MGAGFAAALGFSLTSVLDKAIESIGKFLTQFEEIKKIMKESALEVAEIYARAAFDAMSPQKQLVELERQRLEIAQQLASLQLWHLDAKLGSITREFKLTDFVSAFEFMKQIAIEAESHNHHPEWRNVYNKVWITWTTHDVNGLSIKDIQLAQICDQLFLQYT